MIELKQFGSLFESVHNIGLLFDNHLINFLQQQVNLVVIQLLQLLLQILIWCFDLCFFLTLLADCLAQTTCALLTLWVLCDYINLWWDNLVERVNFKRINILLEDSFQALLVLKLRIGLLENILLRCLAVNKIGDRLISLLNCTYVLILNLYQLLLSDIKLRITSLGFLGNCFLTLV